VLTTPSSTPRHGCVQTGLTANNQRGEKPCTHDHDLKGTLYRSCGAKTTAECPTGKSSITYEHFTCSGRRKKNGCTRSAILTGRIEDRIEPPTTPTASQQQRPVMCGMSSAPSSISSNPPPTTNVRS
jgi:hypothetical protein